MLDKILWTVFVALIFIGLIWGDKQQQQTAAGCLVLALMLGMFWCVSYGASGRAERDKRTIQRWIDDE